MSNVGTLVAVMAFAVAASARAQSPAPAEPELQLVAECNGAAPSNKRRVLRACEELATRGRLGLATPAASVAYQEYQAVMEHWQACQRRQLAVPARNRLSCPRRP